MRFYVYFAFFLDAFLNSLFAFLISFFWIMGLGYVESIQNQYVMVVFGQSHDVPLRGDLESAAAGDLDVRALEL